MSPHPEAPESPLERYTSKRNARTTNEPAGAEPLYRPTTTREASFVVHLHEATRTHYDLRLEVGGVLKSFAVPRGPSLDPRDRRLAIQTEDHPIEYLEYEGVIPKGNYGAGPMVLWDTGRVRYLERPAEEGLRLGKLDFVLSGYKLRGRFALVLSHRQQDGKNPQRQWLLLKKQDAFSNTEGSVIEQNPRSVLSGLTTDELAQDNGLKQVETLAREYGARRQPFEMRGMQPMLCAEVTNLTPAHMESMLSRRGWQYELKLDGVRIVADKHSGEVALWSRRGTAVTQNYPEIARAVRALPAARLVLDGEIIAIDALGRPSFARVAQRIHARVADVWQLAREVPVSYVVFDLLAVGDWDLRELPLRKRKELLMLVVRGNGFLRALDHFNDSGRALFDFCRREHLEGVVAKRADSVHCPGPRRTGDWVKLKCYRDAEFVVIGFTRGEGNRSKLGAIDIATYRGQQLIVRGKVGSGLDQAALETLLDRTHGLERKTCAASGSLEPAPHGRVFVEPRIVISVRFGGWTEEGRLRFPVFQGIRDDLEPQSCVSAPPTEQADDAVSSLVPLTDPADGVSSETRQPGGLEQSVDESPRRVKISNPGKVFWPEDGITKGQLAEYYEQIAGAILPYLTDRPVILVRYPDGIAGKHFYQWNVPQGIPSWVPTLELPPENGRGRARQGFLINDLETLRYVVNLGCIPIHVLASRAQTLDTCDFITLDLDVGALSLREAIIVAHTLRELIDSAGLESFPKTSGQSGLHMLVPLGPNVPYDAAQLLVELLGRLATSRHPDIATMERRRDRRGPRIYVDTGQTGPSRAIVAPYSVRAVPRATVSTPLVWDEVSLALDVSRFDIASVPHRLKVRADPMRSLLAARPDIPRALGLLEGVIRGSV